MVNATLIVTDITDPLNDTVQEYSLSYKFKKSGTKLDIRDIIYRCT